MKILVVDDHTLVRQGLAALLRDQGAATEIVHAGDVAQALAVVATRADLDAVLLDLRMPGIDGLTAIGEIGRRRPELPVLVLSSSEDPEDVRQALERGALGYVPKSASPEVLISAVRMVMAGEIYVPSQMLQGEPPPRAKADRGPLLELTPRQGEVLEALAIGLSNKQIGRKFNLSEKTVKAHVGAIFRTLAVTNRTQAANAAQAAGLIPQPPPAVLRDGE
jgi:two-component system, NarL family, nitrate/nitrite response regulator NarL